MPFYMDIAEPARKRATNKLQPQTEAEMDPMGFTTTPRAPIASGPDVPTAQPLPLAPSPDRPMSQAEMMDAARAYPEQPEPGSIAARLGLERRDTLPLAQEDLFSKTGQAAVEYVGKPLQKYVGEPISAFKEVLAQGTPYIGQALEGNLSELYKAPGGPVAAYEEPTADVLGLFRNQSPKEVYGKVLESHYEKPLWGQLLTEIFFPGPDWLIPVPARLPGGLGARTGGGVGKFNIPASSTVWRDAPAAVKATIKTGIQEQIGEKVAAQVRQVAPDLAPNRVDEIVDILIDDFMKPGMKPEEFQKHADLVIDRVRGYDRPPTARPTVRPDAAPVPALEPAAPVGVAPEPAVVTPRAIAAVTPEPVSAVSDPVPGTPNTIGDRGIRLTVDEIDPTLPDSRTFTLERVSPEGEVIDDLFVFMDLDGKTVNLDIVRKPTDTSGLVTPPKDFISTPGEIRDVLRTVKSLFPDADEVTGLRSTEGRRATQQTLKLPSKPAAAPSPAAVPEAAVPTRTSGGPLSPDEVAAERNIAMDPENANRVVLSAVDRGEPFIVYHGSRRTFDVADIESNAPSYMGDIGEGIYFAADPDTALFYGENLYKTSMKLENPLVIDPEEVGYRSIPELEGESVLVGEMMEPFDVRIGNEWHQVRDGYDLSAIGRLAKEAGHDAVIATRLRTLNEILVLDRNVITPSPAAGVPEAAAIPEPEGLVIQRERQFIQKERIEQHDIVTPSEIAEGKFANVVPRVTADASVHQELLMSNGANAENLYTRAKELGLKEVTVWQGTNAEGAFGIFDSEQILPAQTGGPFGAGFNLSPDAATAWHGGKAIGPEFRGGLGKEGTDNLPVIVQFKMPVELLKDISYDQSIDAYSLNTLEPIPIDKASTKLVYSADPDSPYPYRYFNLLEDEVAGLPRDLLEPIPSIWQRIAPGSTDPVEIRFAYNDELKAYVGRRFVEEQKSYNDLLYTQKVHSINPRHSHLDKLREVFENRVAAEGGIRMISAADLRRIGDDLLDEVRSQPIGQERVPRLIDLRTLREVAPAETGVRRAYHGTVATFDAFRHGASADNSLYGPGVYLTDDPNIATGYAKGSLRIDRNYSGQPIDNAGNVISEQEAFELSQGAPQIWSVDVEVVKFFDIDAPADKEIMDMIRDNPEDWENGFDEGNYDFEDIKTNHDLYDLLVFNFGGVSSAKWEVNDWLAFRGYDTITHVGGGRTGNLPHRVYIALGDPYAGDEITSISPQFGPMRGKEPAVKVIEALPPAPTRPALQPSAADQGLAYREWEYSRVANAEVGDILRPYVGGKQYELISKNPDQWESIAHIEGRLRQLEEVPETGAVVFKNRLLEEVSDGLDPEVAMDATAFIDSLPPNLLDELRTSFRDIGDETTTIQTGEFSASAVAGTYRHSASLVTIIKSVLNQSADPSRIIIHEIFHHLEQFIPEEELNLLRNQWRRDMADNGERVLKTAAYLRSQADLRPLTDAERVKINKAYRYEGDNFNEWFAETMSDKALRDIYADLPEYRNPLQRAFDTISDIAVAVMNFLLRKGRKDEAEQIYQRILKNEFPERLRYQRTGPGKDDLRFEEAPIGRDAELSGDPSLLFDIRNTRQGPGAPMWTVFYKGTDTRLELSTLGRAGSRSKQSAERIAAEEAQKIKTRAEAEGAPPPRGPEPPETGLDPEQPLTPSVPALVQDNLDRAKLQIELTTGGTGQTLNNIPGISDAQGFFFPKYRMTPELHQSWVAAGMTEWELNTQMGLGRARLFEQLKAAFGEDALKGWKPPIPGDDIKGGIQQMARYYTENSNTVYLAPFIGDEAERRAFSGTLFDIATRPDMYELNEAQRAALATWKSHQDDFMDIIIAGYGVDVEKYAVPGNAVFLSNVNVGEGAIEASQTTYQAVTSGGRKHRLFDTAAERQELNPDFIPETDIEALQTGMDMAKSHWAARSTLKLGSGGISKIELMELAHPDLVAAREATIRKVNSLKGRIDTAERRAVGVQSELDPLATRIKNLDDRIDSLDTQIGDLGLEYGPMLSHLSGELYSLKTVLSEAQGRSEVLVERGVSLVDTDKDLIAQLEEAAQDLKEIRERYKGALPTVKVQVGMTSKSINYKLVEEGGLYQYFPVKDVNGIEVAKAAREIVKAENNSIVKLLNNIQQTVLGGDLSPLAAIQGHLALIANPKQIIFKLVGAGKGSVQSRDMLHIFREETMNKVIEENWDDVQDLARYLGLPFVANTPEEFAGGFLKYLKGNIGGKEFSYVKANDAMFAITLRNMLTGYQTNMKMLAAEGITGEEAKIISAIVVSDYIPLINWRLAGLSAAQYNARRAFVTSASYIVKPLELVSSMTTGLGKVATGQTLTPRERLSLRIGFNMIATVTALSVATSMYAALRNDEDPVQAGLNAVNPTHPDFATIHLSWTHLPYVQDQKLPMGGPFRAIAKMFAPRDVSWSPVPVPFATLPQWITNRVGPGLQALYRGAIDRDFYGYKIRKGGGPEQAIRTALFGLESVLPLMPQTLAGGLRRGMEFGESMSDATWQFFGTDARQDSAWQERNKSAARWAESQNFNYDVGGYKDLRGRDRNLYDKTVLGEKQTEAVYQKVKRDAEVGQIPWAMDLLASMDAQRKAEGFQESDDEKLERFYDPAFAGTGPRESLNPTEWKQQRKQRSLELRTTKKAIHYSPEESKWLPQYELDDTDPTDRFFEKMAEIMNEADIDQMDNQAWDDLDQWVSEQSQEDQEYIEVDAYGGALTPKVQEYYDDIAKLEKYWQIEEDFFKNVVNDPNIKFLWDQYKNATQAEKATGMYSSLDSIDKALTDLRQRYRYENEDVDGILAKWDYSGIPVHPENFARWVRLPVLPDFQIREAGQTQVPAQPAAQPSPTATPALSWESLISGGSPQPMAQPAAPTPTSAAPTQLTWESLVGAGAR